MAAIITFLPEPLYTVTMAIGAVAITVLGTLGLLKVCLKLLDSDSFGMAVLSDEQPESTTHLNHTYSLKDQQTGRVFEVITTPEGRVMSIEGDTRYELNNRNVRLVPKTENGIDYLIVNEDNFVVREMQMTNIHIKN